MRFNPKARLDTSRVRDVGSGGGGGGGLGGGRGGMRLPIPTGKGGVGSIVVVIIVVIGYFLGINPFGGGGSGGLGGPSVYSPARLSDAQGTDRYANCKTGEDANNSADCARVAVENSLNDYWASVLGDRFRSERGVVTFTGSVDTGCGPAGADVGPFYCPTDQTIYLDTTFFKNVLQDQLGGPEGAFVEPYVLAHEFGHHISNLLGFMGKVKGGTGPQSDGVRLELQADCYAGLWTKHATETKDASGEVLIQELTQQDIDEAMRAAKTVGDDYIQKRAGGGIDEESWTHGSSDQRQNWFMIGYEEGDVEACDTFSAPEV